MSQSMARRQKSRRRKATILVVAVVFLMVAFIGNLDVLVSINRDAKVDRHKEDHASLNQPENVVNTNNITDHQQAQDDQSQQQSQQASLHSSISEQARSGTTAPSSSLLPSGDPIIPRNLIFTAKHNILKAPPNLRGGRMAVFISNVENTIALHPNSTVHFLTDEDCMASIGRVMGTDSILIKQFLSGEVEGKYRADMCRGAALYELGGYYFDIDLKVRLNAIELLQPNTTFATVRVPPESVHGRGFFQAFMASTPGNPILKRYLDLFEMHYNGTKVVDGLLGVVLLRMAHDDVMGTLEEPKPYEDHHQQVELWFETLYNRTLFPDVPRPPLKRRPPCQHVVATSLDEPPRMVPFFSHIEGSTMCIPPPRRRKTVQ